MAEAELVKEGAKPKYGGKAPKYAVDNTVANMAGGSTGLPPSVLESGGDVDPVTKKSTKARDPPDAGNYGGTSTYAPVMKYAAAFLPLIVASAWLLFIEFNIESIGEQLSPWRFSPLAIILMIFIVGYAGILIWLLSAKKDLFKKSVK